jgi:DNA-binding FadR family transcriptional regulator
LADTSDRVEAGSNGLVEKTVTAIMALIRNENLRVGDALPSENALAERLGVSRVIVREANRSLSALGILDRGNGRAARVSVPDAVVFSLMFDHVVYSHHVSVQQVLAVRRAIEIKTASLAAIHRTEAEAEAILGYARGMRDDFHQADLVREHDLELHRAIAHASRNPMFVTMVLAFESVSRANWPIGWLARGGEDGRRRMITVHEAIARAIADRDAAAAEAAMADHFDDTVQALAIAGVS